MKLKFIYFIPIYGMFKYFNTYFAANKRGFVETTQALYMQYYHWITGLFVLGIPILWLINKFNNI